MSVPAPENALRRRAGLLVLALGTLPVPLDTSVNIALPAFAAAFGLDIVSIKWIVIFYVLTYSSLMLVFGRLGDVTSYARVFQAGLVLSVIGLMACGLARDFAMLLGGRVIQGVGSALVLACGPALATNPFPESERTRLLGFYATVAALGATAGPLLGGLALEWIGWQGVFLMRVPLALAALLLSPWLADGERSGGGTVDLTNAVLLIGAMGLFSLSVGGALGPLTPYLAIASVLLGSAWVLHARRSPAPILELAPFRDPALAVVTAAGVVVYLASFSVLLIVPFFLAGHLGLAGIAGGLVLAMNGAGAILGASAAGRLAPRVGTGRLALAGLVVVSASLISIAFWRTGTPVAVLMATLTVQGLGLGLFQVAASDIVTATLPRHARGVAGSLTMVMRTVGVISGASLLGLIHRHAAGVCLGPLPLEGCTGGAGGAPFAITLLAAGGGLALFVALSLLVPSAWRQRTT